MADGNGFSAHADYLKNKVNQQHQSKVKNLLYGGDRPETPQQPMGKKSVAHRGAGGAPFATYDAAAIDGGQMPKTYQALKTKKEGAGKINGIQFDSSVYANNRATSDANLSGAKARNWGSANLLSNKPNTPQVPQHGPEDQLPSPGAEEASYQSHYQQQQDMGYGGGGYAPTPGRGAYH